MLDIAATKEAFRANCISDIAFVRSTNKLAVGLTKVMSHAAPKSLLGTGLLDVNTEQWIIHRERTGDKGKSAYPPRVRIDNGDTRKR